MHCFICPRLQRVLAVDLGNPIPLEKPVRAGDLLKLIKNQK
jgi:hypothetical protein